MKFVEFNNIIEFKKFVYRLKAEDIQNFSYEDWNTLFAKILNLYDKLKIEENLDKLKSDYKKKHNTNIDTSLSGNDFFTNYICNEEFIKLYSNFKLTDKDWNIALDIAKNIAIELYKKDIDLADVLVNKAAKKQMVITADMALLKITRYSDFYEDTYDFMKSKITFNNENWGATSGTTKYKTHNAEINIDDDSDRILNTAVHETVHAQYQQNTALQRHMKNQNIIAFGVSKELSDLFENNQKFYMRTDEHLYCNLFGYSRQPVEYYAKLIGSMAEREFRKLSHQYSERNFILLNNYLSQFLNIDNTIRAKYDNDCIEAFYPIEYFDKIYTFKKSLSPYLQEKIKFFKNEKMIKLRIATGFECGRVLEKHLKKIEKEKLISKSIKYSLLKKIPICGIGVGIYLGIKRLINKNGTAIMAPCEFFSGIISSMDVGLGSMISLGIDSIIYKYDEVLMKKTNHIYNNVMLNIQKNTKLL